MGQVDKIKFSNNVRWLKPFVRVAQRKVPLRKLKSIMGYRVQKKLEQVAYAALTQYENERKYVMSVRIYDTKRIPITRRRIHKKTRLETILLSLAHELAHLVHWEHTPEHFKLQSEIMILFYDVIKSRGITDHMTRHPQRYFMESK